MLNYRPLVYFWIVQFEDGTALSQFDPETGKENRADPDWLPSQTKIAKDSVYSKKLVKLGWYPFNRNFASKVLKATGTICIPTDNPTFEIDLKNGDQPLLKRENTIKFNLSGQEISRETIYVLGKIGGKVLRICEDGSVES